MTKPGYNIAESWRSERTIADAQRAQADIHLVMTEGENPSQAIGRWCEWVGANHILWREYDRREGNWSIYPTPSEQIAHYEAQGDSLRHVIRDDPCNEPSLRGLSHEAVEKYVSLRVELLERASIADIPIAVGAFSVGNPHEQYIEDGTFDPLIRSVAEGNHYFSVHEYCPGIPGVGDGIDYDALLDPATIISKMPTEIWELDPDNHWLLRRGDRLIHRARQLGLDDPQIIVSECFVDNIDDIGDERKQWLRRNYGQERFNYDLRGMLSWERYYDACFPDTMHFPDYIDYLVRYVAEKVYNVSWIKGACLFAINKNWS